MVSSQWVIILPTVDGDPKFGELKVVPVEKAKQSTAVDRVSNKKYFSHLKKGPPEKISLSVRNI